MSSDSDSDHPVSAAEEAFQQRQMAVVKRLGAQGVAADPRRRRGCRALVARIGGGADFRIVVITKERAAAIETARRFAVGMFDDSDDDGDSDDDDCGLVMFDTSSGNAGGGNIAGVKKAVRRDPSLQSSTTCSR